MNTYYLGKKVTVVLGAAGGDDFIATADTLVTGDVIRGGNGTNTLTLQGAGTFNLNAFWQIVNVQYLDVQEGAGQTVYLRNGLDLEVDAASPDASDPSGGITIYGARNADVIKLGSGNDTVYLGDAAESIYGGGGNDQIWITAATISATFDGGTGTTTLHLTGGGAARMGSNITDIAAVVLEDAPAGQTQPDYVFTANALPGLAIVASAGNDTITLGAAGQSVTAGAGVDDLIGAASGGDTFKGTAGALNGDTIENFASAGYVIDVTDVPSAAAQIGYAGTAAGGTLTVSDGTHTAEIKLVGLFAPGGFHPAPDGSTGTAITYSLPNIATAVSGELADDTGVSSIDGVTRDPAIAGVTSAFPIIALTASLDNGSGVDVLVQLKPDGSFALDGAVMASIAGGSLADGPHSLVLTAIDQSNQSATLTIVFTLETAPPLLSAVLANNTTATPGVTSDPSVTGTVTDPVGIAAFSVSLDGQPAVGELAQLAANGGFQLSAVQVAALAGGTLADGNHMLVFAATDTAGNTSMQQVAFTLVPASTSSLQLSAALADDTGISATDGITSDSAITGTLTDTVMITALTASLDGGMATSELSLLQSNGASSSMPRR